jgi:UDP-N-acetylmuramoylalanine--D-glutamate ligase
VDPPPNRPPPALPPGPYLVVGLARSGSAIARALAARGEEVIGCDTGRPREAQGLEGTGVEVHLDADGIALLGRAACVVKSPGVPAEAPVIAAARARVKPVIGELEAAWRMLPNRFIAVTGTNGKTTVTELLGEIHDRAAQPAAVAGNVGTPLASLVGELSEDATVVCECSSFQLEDAELFAPECAVFLNFAPDHLDRHASLDDYLEAKLRIFANQGNEDVAVYDGDEPALARRELGGRARRAAFCTRREGGDCELTLSNDVILRGREPLIETERLRLLGEHNVKNAMAAAAAALAMGVPADAVRAGLASFGGVAHRLEPVRELRGVTYVNDSKATNVAATEAALRSFEGGVHVILGGSLKGESFADLVPTISARCVACYLIGEAAASLATELAPARDAGVELRRCGGMEHAVEAAAKVAAPGQVVLLAPACASFDAYRDFEHRGEHFRALVEALR